MRYHLKAHWCGFHPRRGKCWLSSQHCASKEEEWSNSHRICVDFFWRDFNKACQKDDFPFRDWGDYWPHIILWGVLVPGWPGYNQIKMDAEDQKHTAFRTQGYTATRWCLSGGLKMAVLPGYDQDIRWPPYTSNCGVLCRWLSCQGDLKGRTSGVPENRIHALKEIEPENESILVSFIGQILRIHSEIQRHRDRPGKDKGNPSSNEMPPPKNLKELHSFQGRLAYLRRCLSNLSGRIPPFTYKADQERHPPSYGINHVKGHSRTWNDICCIHPCSRHP